MTTILLLLKQLPNLWFLVNKAPAVIAVIRMIIEAVGSEMFQNIIESVKDIIQNDETLPEKIETADPIEKKRLLNRFRERFALKFLNLEELEYNVMQRVKRNQTSEIPSVHRNAE